MMNQPYILPYILSAALVCCFSSGVSKHQAMAWG